MQRSRYGITQRQCGSALHMVFTSLDYIVNSVYASGYLALTNAIILSFHSTMEIFRGLKESL
jgi:hypothetical protein